MIACLATLPFIMLPQAGSDEAKLIVTAWREKLAAAKTVSGALDSDRGRPNDRMLFRMSKPDHFSFKSPGYEMLGSGEEIVMHTVDAKKFLRLPASYKEQLGLILPGMAPFFGLKVPYEEKRIGMGAFKGAQSAEITYTFGSSGTANLYIDRTTKLPLAMMTKMGTNVSTATYSDIKLDEPMDAESFKWTPPVGVTEEKMEGPQDYEKDLLKIGTKAPDFTLKTPKGKSLNLAKSLKSSKGMLVNFWFYG